jgi:hypothetical protein
MPPDSPSSAAATDTRVDALVPLESPAAPPVEEGGPSGPEPTRFGDWERKGRCIDF